MDLDMADQLFYILLICGLLLIGAEIFVPGGILGVIGSVFLVGAIGMAFVAFHTYGAYVAIGILILLGLTIALWIKFFPGSRFGRKMTVSSDLEDAKATADGLDVLEGREGTTLSELHPAGFARIDGRRIDVITRGEMISAGEAIRVVAVEGNRVVVRSSQTEKAS